MALACNEFDPQATNRQRLHMGDTATYPESPRHTKHSSDEDNSDRRRMRRQRRQQRKHRKHTRREALFLDKADFLDNTYRFTFFSTEVGTVRARELEDLRTPTHSLTFGIHALTVEDIMTQDSREKCEVHHSYYFVSFRSFVSNPDSELYMQPINMYNVVMRRGIIS
ncbi:hypothetical protein EV182_006140, partial [Spiromyces aspiralis]